MSISMKRARTETVLGPGSPSICSPAKRPATDDCPPSPTFLPSVGPDDDTRDAPPSPRPLNPPPHTQSNTLHNQEGHEGHVRFVIGRDYFEWIRLPYLPPHTLAWRRSRQWPLRSAHGPSQSRRSVCHVQSRVLPVPWPFRTFDVSVACVQCRTNRGSSQGTSQCLFSL